MKKRIFSLFLTILLIISLLPTKVFAGGGGYAITNGTLESAKETNHGYITIDKTTAGSGDTVTVTVNPEDGYELKSLSCTPTVSINTIADVLVLATAERFPEGTGNKQPPSNAWVCGDGHFAFVYNGALIIYSRVDDNATDMLLTATVTAGENCYTVTSGKNTLTFNMTNGILNSITFSSTDEIANGWYGGTYTSSTITPDDSGTIILKKQTDGTYQFTMPAYAVTVTAKFENIPVHTHAFTYMANNDKLIATCTEGCDKGYDTNSLTLTLIAPENIVYDTNAKEYTFAGGEADAWTGAGLELPTVTYAAKSGSSLTDSKAVDAGSYTASITVDMDKTASLDFEITKATPYIKNNPAPSDITYGQKLSDSTLFGGYVQVSSTDSAEIAGLFEWTEPDTIPAIADSDTTLYSVIFTPIDEKNYNSVSCQVTITVTHTHNPEKVNGQAPTKTAAGWKDYYECACGDLFEDASGTIPIENLARWKAEDGNGYLPPLPTESYTVTFDMGGHGTAPADQKVNEGDKATKPETDPTADGYTFGGWYADATFNTAFDFNTAITADTTVYAKWTENPPTPAYIIVVGANSEWTKGTTEGLLITSDAPFAKFDSVKVDGSTIASTNYVAEAGSTKITLAPAYLETMSVGTHSIEIVSNDGSASTSFTVKAAQPPVPTTYTVTFDMCGHGTAPADQKVNEGDKATKPETDPTADGYTFGGWYADATFNTAFDFNMAITADTTVYAKWTKDSASPQTGDNGHMLLWFVLLIVSGSTLIGTTVYGKKGKELNNQH